MPRDFMEHAVNAIWSPRDAYKRPVFSCESEKPGKSQGEKKLLENKRWWNLQAAGKHTQSGSVALQRISESTSSAGLEALEGAVFKGLAFAYVKVQINDNALDY